MAKLQSGILENFSGSIGDLNFYKWKNKFVIRAKRTSTKKPPSEAQILAREKFRILGNLYNKLKESSRIGFQSFTSSMTEKNAFFKCNHSAISKTENGLMVNYPDLVLSSGSIKGLQVIAAKIKEGLFSLTWKSQYEWKGNEKIHIVLLPLEDGHYAYLSEFSYAAEKLEIQIPPAWNTSKFYAYLFIANKKNDVSNSQYLGDFS